MRGRAAIGPAEIGPQEIQRSPAITNVVGVKRGSDQADSDPGQAKGDRNRGWMPVQPHQEIRVVIVNRLIQVTLNQRPGHGEIQILLTDDRRLRSGDFLRPGAQMDPILTPVQKARGIPQSRHFQQSQGAPARLEQGGTPVFDGGP